jgi:hypothetical protein
MGISNPKLKSMGLAFGVSAFAAIGTMFLPVALLESLTGATGLSELVPATAAPLGDTARALIAFGTGALTLAVMAIFLLRKERLMSDLESVTFPAAHAEPATSLKPADILSGLKARFGKLSLPKMPWAKNNEDDILDLADLPKLRTLDAHPDAPARRPFSAGSDLDLTADLAEQPSTPAPQTATPDLHFWPERPDEVQSGVTEAAVQAPVIAPTGEWPLAAKSISEVPVSEQVSVVETAPVKTVEAAVEDTNDAQPSLAILVNQLEQAVLLRQQQLSALEIVAAQLKSEAVVAVIPDVAEAPLVHAATVDPVLPLAEPIEAVRFERPSLEAVPMPERKMADDGMDAALNAALETLQRMNAQGR